MQKREIVPKDVTSRALDDADVGGWNNSTSVDPSVSCALALVIVFVREREAAAGVWGHLAVKEKRACWLTLMRREESNAVNNVLRIALFRKYTDFHSRVLVYE